MEEDKQSSLKDLEDRVSDAVATMTSRSAVEQDNAKMRVAYYERLIILCGGTLALSFTAALNFHGRIGGANSTDIHSLLMAWKLLLGGIVGCFVSNFFALASAANDHLWITHSFMNIGEIRIERVLKTLDPSATLPPGLKTPEQIAKAETAKRRALRFRNVSVNIGIASQIVIFISFFYLYWFAKSTLFGK